MASSLTNINRALIFCALLFACRAPLTEEAAFRTITALPEVQTLSTQLRNTNDKTLIIRKEESSDDSHFMRFYVGESSPDHTVLWEYIVVDSKTGEIFIEDALNKELLTLEQWRSQQH